MSVSKTKMTAIAATLSVVGATAASPATYYEVGGVPVANFINSEPLLYDMNSSLFGVQQLGFGFYTQETTRTDFTSSFFQETFISEMIPEIRAAQEVAERQAALIAETHFMSAPNADGRVFVTISPEGLEVDAQPLTFDHVSGPVGIMRELSADGTTSDYVFAAVGIDTDDIVMTQVIANGPYAAGDSVPMSNPDINKSENSRVSVAFTPEMGAIQELQFVLPHDADPDQDITISLKDSNGNVTQVIPANDYQIVPANQSRFANVAETGDVPDFLVLVIRNDSENLSTIYNTMLNDGSFEVQAMSPMGRLVPSPAAFGSDMAAHLSKAYEQLAAPQFHFAEPTDEVQRLYSYDPNSQPVDHVAQQCVVLGLQDMSEAERENIRVFNALVEGGTGVRPRDFEKGYVAVDEFNKLVAAGSAAWLGSNVLTQQARVSGSAPTGFLTEGGELLSGCTDDNIVTWSTPVTPTPYTSVTIGGYTSLFTSTTTGTGFWTTGTGGGNPGGPGGGNPGPSPVPIEGAEWVFVKAAEQIDKATGVTQIAEPARKFFDKHWTPFESGSLLLGSALFMLGGGVGATRRRLTSAFTTAKDSVVDTTKMVVKDPVGFTRDVGRSIGLG